MNVRSANLAQRITLATESPMRDLAAIIRSRTPLIAVESNEEPQIVRLMRQIAQTLQLRAYRWSVTEGLQAFDPQDQPREAFLKSQEVLSYIKTEGNGPPTVPYRAIDGGNRPPNANVTELAAQDGQHAAW